MFFAFALSRYSVDCKRNNGSVVMMKILVCIKQVPDMESRFRLNEEGTWFEDTDIAWRMNEYDEYAVEQAIRLKEQVGDADLTVLSIGPDRIQEMLKKALAMGCDRGVHIYDEEAYKRDPYVIASLIAEFSKDKKFDFIFTGLQSQDRGSCQVGVLLGEILGIASITTIVDFAYEEAIITVKRELEGGANSVIKTSAPVLLTCQLGLNTPRYPTLPNILKAKNKELLSIQVADYLKDETKQKTEKIYFPEKKGGGLVLEGEAESLADQLIKILKDKSFLRT